MSRDQVWVKFPIATSSPAAIAELAKARRSSSGPPRRGHPGQPRDQLLAEDRIWPLRGHRAPAENWANPGDLLGPRGRARDRSLPAGAHHRLREAGSGFTPTIWRRSVCAHPLGSAATMTFEVPLLAGDHVTDDTGTGFVHTAPGPRPRRLRGLDRERGQARGARHRHRDPLYGGCRRPLHRAGAGIHRQARAHRKGREGRRQRGGHQGADRCRHADRPRPAQAPISAFLALEKAGDLPQHAAMVHRDGQGYRGRGRCGESPATRCAPARSPPSR